MASGDTRSGDNEVHEHVVLSGHTACLREDLLHLAYPDIFTWVEKHNRYSNWEARVQAVHNCLPGERHRIGSGLARKRLLKLWSRRLPFRPSLRFLYSYILQRGFLDGFEGYVLCRLLATYEMLSVVKARELRLLRCRGLETLRNT
jgi:hypothetical protein